jgi:hypothetical protein
MVPNNSTLFMLDLSCPSICVGERSFVNRLERAILLNDFNINMYMKRHMVICLFISMK